MDADEEILKRKFPFKNLLENLLLSEHKRLQELRNFLDECQELLIPLLLLHNLARCLILVLGNQHVTGCNSKINIEQVIPLWYLPNLAILEQIHLNNILRKLLLHELLRNIKYTISRERSLIRLQYG